MGIAALRRHHSTAPIVKPNEKPVVAIPDRPHTRVPDNNGFRVDKLAAKINPAKK